DLRIKGLEACRKATAAWLASFEGPIRFDMRDLEIAAGPETAFSFSLNRVRGKVEGGHDVDMWVRATVGFRMIAGRWMVTHEHVSVPFDTKDLKARVDLEP